MRTVRRFALSAAVLLLLVLAHDQLVAAPGDIHGNRTWTTHDGRQFEAAFAGFDVGTFKLYRRRGKVYIDAAEYGKLSEDRKYSVDRVLERNGVSDATQLAKQLRGATRTFGYAVAHFSKDGKAFVLPIDLLAAEDITTLSAPFQAWRGQKLREIAAENRAREAKEREARERNGGDTSYSSGFRDGWMHSGPGGETSYSTRYHGPMGDGWMHSGPGGETSYSSRYHGPMGDGWMHSGPGGETSYSTGW